MVRQLRKNPIGIVQLTYKNNKIVDTYILFAYLFMTNVQAIPSGLFPLQTP
jgi:hypothetical protein